MFGVEARSDGRGEIADDGFGDAVETEGNGGAAETVLQQADDHAEKQSGGRIAAAQAKINGDQQRKVEQRSLAK